jgi:hypothetical protein
VGPHPISVFFHCLYNNCKLTLFVPSWACEVDSSIKLYEKTNWWIHVIFIDILMLKPNWQYVHDSLGIWVTMCLIHSKFLLYFSNLINSQHCEYILPKSLAFMNMKLNFMTNDILHAISYLVNCQTNTKSILQSCSYYLWSMGATIILYQDGSWRMMNNDFVLHNTLFQSSI